MGPKRTEAVGSLWMVTWLLVAVSLAWPTGTATGATGPLGTTVSPNEFMLVVKPGASADQVKQVLADAGFGEPEAIQGLPPRFRNCRQLKVPAANETVRQQLLGLSVIQAVRPVYRLAGVDYPILSTGQVIVRFKPGVTEAQARETAAANDCTVGRQIAGLPRAYVFDADESRQDASAVASRIAGLTNVQYSHPSMLFKLRKYAAPTDPLYSWQWHLKNRGQLPGGRPGADIDVEPAWNLTLGAGAIVGVIDDSIQREHEDLVQNYITGYDFLDQDPDPSPTYGPGGLCFWIDDPGVWVCDMDSVGEAHGTAVSGLICAAANTIGVRGVAPEAGLIGCKIGLGPFYSSDQDIADAFLFASANGAMVINNSWGGPGGAVLPTIPNTEIFLPDLISDAIQEVATNGRGGRGVLITFAAGNDDIPISFGNMYAAVSGVMAVGATLRDDTLTCYSNFGPEQSVVAPGGGFAIPRDMAFIAMRECFGADMATTDNMEVPGYYVPGFPGWPIRGYNPMMKFLSVVGMTWCPPGFGSCLPLVPDEVWPADFENPNYTRHFNGTSAACPVATGVAALVFSVAPDLTAEQARNLIEHTADKPTHLNEVFDTVAGRNDRYGHGRVNARRAVEAAVAGKLWPNPIKDLQNVSAGALGRLIWTNPIDAAGVLVARGAMGQLDWIPQDGVSYIVGQQVAPGVIVVGNGLFEQFDQSDMTAGDYAYALFVRNTQTNYSWGRRASFESPGTIIAPQASMSASPMMGRAPLTVHFAGGAIDAGGVKNLSFSWQFGDGGTAFGPTAAHKYLVPGEYIARLRVVNGLGQSGAASLRITVLPEYNLPPTTTILAGPTSGTAPLVVTFEAVAADADGVVVSYLWDFGDGSTGAGRKVEHTFINAGTYGVKLTVTDDLGATATDAVLITVQATSATAARTSPENALGVPCGGGVPPAMAGAAIGMLGLLGWRRGSNVRRLGRMIR
ncbi:MAG TPA: S8 family serine peptidase [Phycisphaerae bacterium]|nr:S8 family serine peptidase [Phycisphaerae bacterium]